MNQQSNKVNSLSVTSEYLFVVANNNLKFLELKKARRPERLKLGPYFNKTLLFPQAVGKVERFRAKLVRLSSQHTGEQRFRSCINIYPTRV